jgi:hypothetical protein
MSTIERKEKIKIEYDGSKIIIRGSTFKMAAPMNMMSLMGIYASGEGTSTVHLILDVEDPVAEPEVKEESKPEEVIVANTEPTVNVVNTEVVVEEAEITVNTAVEVAPEPVVEVIMIDPEKDVEPEPVVEVLPEPEPEVKEKDEFDLSGENVSGGVLKEVEDSEFDINVKKEPKSEFDPFNTKGPTGDKWSTFG